jgi:hypothetical protein
MPSRVIVTGIVLITIVALLVFTIEFFLPLSMKNDMNAICRNTLLKMETDGGLSEQDRLDLLTNLQKIGLTDILVSGTQNAKQGDLLDLHVEALYTGSRLTALMSRKTELQLMVYDKKSLSRKVVN